MSLLLVYKILICFIFIISPITFVGLLFKTAPYGKHTEKGWGLKIQSKLGWFLMEIPAVFVIAVFYLKNYKDITFVPFVFLMIWQAHYIYRTFIYPFLLRGSKKTFPVLLVVFAVVFNTINGYINGYYQCCIRPEYDLSWFLTPQFILGTITFFTGYFVHIYSDMVIRNLRKPGEKEYKIPQGWIFRFISNPNYFGEIIQWFGFALLTFSLPGLAFAVFTFANLAPRAIANHKWYKNQFPDYPKKRKAIIPFIY
jgi:3-oxo-5-alpha-steroid 4-dehydrogenase 1